MSPHCQSSTLASTESTFVEAFPFVARRQLQCDVLVFERNQTGGGDSPTTDVTTSMSLFLLKNPHTTKDAVNNLDDWKRIKVATLRGPRRSLAYADISKNGFNDIIVVDAVEHSDTPIASSRISWLENAGTNATGWKRREIGRCPGARSIKAGHFTNTFSLQVLIVQDVVAEQESGSGSGSRSDFTSSGSLTMFTQPMSFTSRPPWPSSLVSAEVTEKIVDICVVHPSNVHGELDKLLIIGEISVSLVWWEHGKWNTQTISTHINPRPLPLSLDARTKNMVCVGGVKECGTIEFIAYSMLFCPSKLVVCSPSSSPQSLDLQHIRWDIQILDIFSSDIITNIQSISIDGMNGFVVSVVPCNSPQRESQLYLYYPVFGSRKRFERILIAQGCVLDCSVGDFKLSANPDIIALSKSFTNQLQNGAGSNEITIYSLFNTQFIEASIDPSRSGCLVLRVPDPFMIGQNVQELPLFSTLSFAFSLVILGPGQTYDLPPSAAIKVLRGVIKSNQQSPHAIRRPYLAHSGNSFALSMEIDQSPLKTCMRGAIFILLTEEKSVQGLRIRNFSPALLRWEEVPSSDEFFGTKVFALDGFRLLIDGTDIAHVHFTAFQDRTSLNGPPPLPTLVPGPYSLYSKAMSPSRAICQVRCCIRNTSKRGGMYHSNESCVKSDKTRTTESGEPIPNAWLLPDLTESRPLWHVDDKGNPAIIDGVVSYPSVYGWLSDIEHVLQENRKEIISNSNDRVYLEQRVENGKRGDDSLDVWMDIDFTPGSWGDSDKEDYSGEAQDKRNLFFIISCGFIGAILGLLIRHFSEIVAMVQRLV